MRKKGEGKNEKSKGRRKGTEDKEEWKMKERK
jgi:hypothetical protein